jgi:hypothetical protein
MSQKIPAAEVITQNGQAKAQESGPSPRKIHSMLNDSDSQFRQSQLERMQQLMENKKNTELFKRKVKIIKRHFKNSSHPLRMLVDLFGDVLQRI